MLASSEEHGPIPAGKPFNDMMNAYVNLRQIIASSQERSQSVQLSHWRVNNSIGWNEAEEKLSALIWDIPIMQRILPMSMERRFVKAHVLSFKLQAFNLNLKSY